MPSNHCHALFGLGALLLAACSSPPSAAPPGRTEPHEDLCPEGFADCDGVSDNGCEAALLTSVESCGACGARCAGGDGATALCSAGACTLACDAGRADCDGDGSNGCEVLVAEDPRHCGACVVTCADACWNGTCDAAVLAGELRLPTFLRMDATGLYWTNQGSGDPPDGSVMRLDPGGGTPAALAAEQELPGPLALDEATVYFAHARGLAAVPKAGGEVTELAPDARGVTALAVDQGALYWVEAGTPPAFEDGGLFMLPLGPEPGAAKVMLAAIPGVASGVALDAGHVYVAAQRADAAGGAIFRVARDAAPPSAPERLHEALVAPRGLEARGGALWLIEGRGIATFSPGGPLRRVVQDLPQIPAQLAFDDARVFWTTAREADGQVQSARLDGSDLATHARNLSYPWGIAVDGTNVYFSLAWNGGPATGALVRRPKGP
ncbi:hypothetical protein [Sorangium atrum]|uniref:Lipoprotein n=1 Tax=Sorangium atrum TaxID=2995308 RepID=A0ABT5C2W9_9BACT|nr:hypothetical protein [Sorangium aterium]MDC0679536.1 hypothetical protein [Sorangium aterium]